MWGTLAAVIDFGSSDALAGAFGIAVSLLTLVIAASIAFLMLTWRKGQMIMDRVRLQIREHAHEFIKRIAADPPHQIPGTAVGLGRMTHGVPLSLTHNVNFNHVLHERVLLVVIEMTETPRVEDDQRVTVTPLSERISRVQLRFGFMPVTKRS